jgi:hypothetical protein
MPHTKASHPSPYHEPYADMASHSFHFVSAFDGLTDPVEDEAETYNSYEVIDLDSQKPRVKFYYAQNPGYCFMDEDELRIHIEARKSKGHDCRVTAHALASLSSLKEILWFVD